MLVPLLAITELNYDSYCLTMFGTFTRQFMLFKLPQDIYKILGSDCKDLTVSTSRCQRAQLKLCMQQ